MIVLKKLKSIFSSANIDNKLTTRELVRRQLQRTNNLRDFHLENVSSTDLNEKKEPHFKSISSEVHKNIVYAEERLSDLLSEDDDGSEVPLKNDIEHDINMQTSWTEAVSKELSDDETKD